MAEHDGRRRERTLVELHKDGMRVKLARLAGLQTHSPQDAEDLVQTALANVYNLQDSPWDLGYAWRNMSPGRSTR
jgi:DNA-directed RNA polymerase specialized sigma24 family protein